MRRGKEYQGELDLCREATLSGDLQGSSQGCLDLARWQGLEGPSSAVRKSRGGSSAPFQLQAGPGCGW